MRADFWMLTLALALALGPTSATPSAVSHVRADQPIGGEDARTFDVGETALPRRAPERLVLEKLRSQEYQWAIDLAQSAIAADLYAESTQREDRPAGPHANPARRARMQWLLARALSELERLNEAEAVLADLATSDHPLSSWARLRLGTLQLKHSPERAIATLDPLLEDFPGAPRARKLYALALARCDRAPEALPRLRTLVAAAPLQHAAATVAMPLAELLEKRGSPEEKLEALSLYRRVASRAPQTPVGQHARAQAAALLRTLPKAVRRKHAYPDVEDSFAHGDALMRGRAYIAAGRHYDWLFDRVRNDPELRCRVELERGRLLLRKRKRREAATIMERIANACESQDVQAWARYYAGRARFRLDDPKSALAHYDQLPKVAPGHRLADDGLFHGALAAEELGNEEGMFERLNKLIDEHPNGDMRPEGLFVLAWRAYRNGVYRQALSYFDRLLADGPQETTEGIRGRAAYWRARSLAKLTKRDAAIDAYTKVVEAGPLSYHGRQALSRLDEIAPSRAEKLRKTLLSRPSGDRDHLRFKHRKEMDDPAFAGAVALLQVHEYERAEDAFRYLGMLGGGAEPEALWLAAALYNAAGAHAEASNLSRVRMAPFLAMPPNGPALGFWKVAYPNAFAPLIEQAAEEADVPATFVRAVAREESAFDPEAVSHAHAYGLIQLMRPTAREHAAALGLPSDPASLKRPEINLRIGAHFIRFLWSRYATNPAVVPAAYNAGHGAAERWMRAAPDTPLDEWIESIPYEETRRYTRRVLQSYGIYAWLDTGRLPPLKQHLPRR